MAHLGRRHYYWHTVTVNVGAVNQAVAILTDLLAAGRDQIIGSATWLKVTTDVQITMRINSTTADEITVGTTSGIEVPEGVMAIDNLYLSHTGASSGAGAASVVIFAA